LWLQWNGGPESIWAFAQAWDLLGCWKLKSTKQRLLRAHQIVTNFGFFGDTTPPAYNPPERFYSISQYEVAAVDNGAYMVFPGQEPSIWQCCSNDWHNPTEWKMLDNAVLQKHAYNQDNKMLSEVIGMNAALYQEVYPEAQPGWTQFEPTDYSQLFTQGL